MKYFKTIIPIILLPLALLAQDKLKKEIDTQPGKTLDLELSTGGDIEVSGWDKNVVSLVVHIRGDKEDYYIDVAERSSGIKNVGSLFPHTCTDPSVKTATP